MQKGFGLIGILIVVAVIAGIGAFTFDSLFPERSPFTPSEEEKSAIEMAEEMKGVLKQTNTVGGETSDDDVDVSEVSPSNIDTANWKTYRNEEYGFEFKYPPEAVFNSYSTNGKDYFSEIGALIEHKIDFKTALKDIWGNSIRARISFVVTKKGMYYRFTGEPVFRDDYLKINYCELYNRTVRSFGGKEGVVVESKGCSEYSGEMHATGHTLLILFPLSSEADLLYASYSASFDDGYIKSKNYGEKILSTLKFAK